MSSHRSDHENIEFDDNERKNMHPIYNLDDLRVSSIISAYYISHFDDAFPSGKSNLMASSGKLIFLTILDCIKVYEAANFSSMNPPDPSTFFPFNPIKILKPTPQQRQRIISRNTTITTSSSNNQIIINHIRIGFIGDQQSLVAVGEFGCILVWNLAKLLDEPVLMENSDFSSTWGIAMSPKNFLLATSSNSHAVTIFHFPSGRILFSVEQQQKTFNEETRETRETRETGEAGEIEITQIHKHNIPSLDFSPCGKFLASCSIDGQVVLWSLTSGEVTIIKSSSIEWGWLIRFVPSQQYDLRTTTGKYKKTFYNSNIKESQIYDLPIYETLINVINLSEMDDVEEFSDNLSFEYFDEEEEDEQYSQNYEGIVHLAEGAGDTWPSDSEAEEIVDNREYSDYYDTESSEIDVDVDEDGIDEDEDDNSDDIGDDSKDVTALEKVKINFLNTEGLVLFKPSSKSTPLDLFYCSSESVSVYDTNGTLKLHLPKLKNTCSKRQTTEPLSQYLYGMQFLQNRLAMGEWIFELGIFIVIDCNGQVFISSPKTTATDQSLDLNTTIMIPESFTEAAPIVGYTLIKQYDEEYGVKFHLYIICENGWFRLYEIVKK